VEYILQIRLERNRKLQAALTNYTEDLKIKPEKAIKSSSFFTASKLAGVNLCAAGDETTWGAEVGANSNEPVDPPSRQERLTEVVVALRMACGRHTRVEGPPFGREIRRQWRRGDPPEDLRAAMICRRHAKMEGLPFSHGVRRQ
jgi:hypothetical protein